MPRRWLFLPENDFYYTPRVDLFCALCTYWSVAKYCRLCWKLILFDTRSAALHYCTQAISGTVCLVFRYLLRIKYSAFCTRCSEFWNSVREKHNRVLLATRILPFFFWTERWRGNVNRSPTDPWGRLSSWCNHNLSSNGRKCRPKNSGSAPKKRLKNNDSKSKQEGNRLTSKLCFNSLRILLRWARSYRPQQLR